MIDPEVKDYIDRTVSSEVRGLSTLMDQAIVSSRETVWAAVDARLRPLNAKLDQLIVASAVKRNVYLTTHWKTLGVCVVTSIAIALAGVLLK